MATNRPNTNVAQQPQGPRQRILRIGILLGGKIIEERLIRDRAPVSIGQSMKNTFSIPVEGLPLEFTMFAIDQNKYYLRFLTKMDGRLSDGGQVNTLDALKSRGAQNHGEYWQVPIGDSSRGKLSVGDLTVLFQFVTEPPRQPKPMLPASVRGTFADRFDPRLLVILGASIIAHFAVVIVALAYDADTNNGIADRAYNLTFKPETVTVDLEPPKPDKGAGADQGAKQPDKKPEPKQPTKKPAGNPNPDPGPKKAPDPGVASANAVAAANALTGDDETGKTEAGMNARRPGEDLGRQIDAVKDSGKTAKLGGGSGRGSRNGGDPRTGTGHGPDVNGPGGTQTAGEGKKETTPQGRISVSEKSSDEGLLDPDAVLRKIQSAYMVAIKRCYTSYLKKDASARGKVSLSLTINATGRTTDHGAQGFAGEVDSCISNLMGSWHFPIPKDKDGNPTDASFRIALQLVPD